MIGTYANLWQRLELIRFLVSAKRRGSTFKMVLGQLWFVLNPLAQMFVYYFLVVVLFGRAGMAGIHPLIMILTGIIHYHLFQHAVMSSAHAILGNQKLCLQVSTEPLVFTAVSFVDTAWKFLISLGVYFIFYLVLGPDFSLRLLAYPLILALLVVLAWSGSVLMSVLTVFSRDLRNAVAIALRILMYLSPVIYPASFVAEKLGDAYSLYLLSPIGCLFTLLQWCFIQGQFPPLWTVALLIVSTILVFVMAHVVYGQLRPKITKAF